MTSFSVSDRRLDTLSATIADLKRVLEKPLEKSLEKWILTQLINAQRQAARIRLELGAK